MYFLKDKDLRILFIKSSGVAAPYVISGLYSAALSNELTYKYKYDNYILDFSDINPSVDYEEILKTAISNYKPDITIIYGFNPMCLQLFNSLRIYSCLLFFDDVYNITINELNKYNRLDLKDYFFDLLKSKYTTILISDIEWQKTLLNKEGVESHFFRLGTYSKIFNILPIPSKYKYDISFVGSLNSTRLKLLSSIKNYNVNIWTFKSKEEFSDLPSNFIFHKPCDYEKSLVEVYNNSKINISITMDQLKAGVSQRAFDIPASNGFLLSDYKSDIIEIFGEKAVYFDSENNLNEKIDYYLDKNNETERINYIKYTKEVVLNKHTYLHRFSQIIDILENKYSKLY